MATKDIAALSKKTADAVTEWSKTHADMFKLRAEIDKLQSLLASNGASPAELVKKTDAGVKLGKITAKLGPLEKKLADKSKAMDAAQKELAKAAK